MVRLLLITEAPSSFTSIQSQFYPITIPLQSHKLSGHVHSSSRASRVLIDRTQTHYSFRNAFLGAIRTRTSLPSSILELAISRVAVLNRAWYEWAAHAPLLRQAPGITDDHVRTVLDTPAHQSAAIFDERHAAVMTYVDAMTLNVEVEVEVMEKLKRAFGEDGEKQVVEVTATVAAYNCVSRFLVALDVGERNGKGGKWPLE